MDMVHYVRFLLLFCGKVLFPQAHPCLYLLLLQPVFSQPSAQSERALMHQQYRDECSLSSPQTYRIQGIYTEQLGLSVRRTEVRYSHGADPYHQCGSSTYCQ